MNILILSAGTRNKVVRYFVNALTDEDGGRIGRVITTDMSVLAPAIYEADAHYIVPRMTDPEYLDVILDICRKENVSGVLSLIDPELSLLAAHEDDFADLGVRVIGSSYELCEMSLDKMQMYRWLVTNGYRAARSYDKRDDFYADLKRGLVGFPVFVKPARGSASIAISSVEDAGMLDALIERNDELMIQELMRGQELGVDAYIDLISGEVISIFAKKKLKMRAGETDKAVSIKDSSLFEFVATFVKRVGFRGQIDVDIFEDEDGYIISEVNPRFGGGYPHAYECGCDHMKLIVNNLNGIANKPSIGMYEEGVYMMKYSEVMVGTPIKTVGGGVFSRVKTVATSFAANGNRRRGGRSAFLRWGTSAAVLYVMPVTSPKRIDAGIGVTKGSAK